MLDCLYTLWYSLDGKEYQRLPGKEFPCSLLARGICGCYTTLYEVRRARVRHWRWRSCERLPQHRS